MYTGPDGILISIAVISMAQIAMEYYIAEEVRLFTVTILVLAVIGVAI